jgi:hypothetical protein
MRIADIVAEDVGVLQQVASLERERDAPFSYSKEGESEEQSAYVRMRQHTSAVSIRPPYHTLASHAPLSYSKEGGGEEQTHTQQVDATEAAYVSIRQHTQQVDANAASYVSIRQHTQQMHADEAATRLADEEAAYASIRQHTQQVHADDAATRLADEEEEAAEEERAAEEEHGEDARGYRGLAAPDAHAYGGHAAPDAHAHASADEFPVQNLKESERETRLEEEGWGIRKEEEEEVEEDEEDEEGEVHSEVRVDVEEVGSLTASLTEIREVRYACA